MMSEYCCATAADAIGIRAVWGCRRLDFCPGWQSSSFLTLGKKPKSTLQSNLMAPPKPELSFTLRKANEHILRVYPDAKDSNLLVETFLATYGIPPADILLGNSVCSDDLNNIQYPPSAKDMLGPFNLGGLNGFPFTGLTGMGAFSHHYPDRGVMLIFYGPHIGISNNGVVGEILRPGQTRLSRCCGAARAALEKLEAGRIRQGVPVEPDYQQGTIEQIFLRSEQRILGVQNQYRRRVEATQVMYEAIHDQVNILIGNTFDFECETLFRFGGILINPDQRQTAFIQLEHAIMNKVRADKTLAPDETEDIKDKLMAAMNKY
jgi:hypothetical protein